MSDSNVLLAVEPLKHGKIAPDFTLEGITGSGEHRQIVRENFRGKQGLLILFLREISSATTLLKALAADWAEYQELNANILCISPLSQDTLVGLQKELQLPFALLSDSDARVWRAYTANTGAPYAYGAFVLDTYCGVDSQRVAENLADLPNAAKLLEWMRGTMYRCNI